jgi:vacuolar-type H+-ATPase subunit H
MDFSEYHCCIGLKSETDVSYEPLLQFIQLTAIYTNIGFEYTPTKGHHIHMCIIFQTEYDEAFYKKLTRLRKKLNYIKKDKKNDGLGWYWKKATTSNNLAYILKKETKTRENIEWVRDEIPQELQSYIQKSNESVETFTKQKNKRLDEMKDYIDKHSDSPSEDIIMKLILDFHRKERNVLLPTRAGFNQLVDTLCYDYNIFPVEMLCAKMRYIS